MGWPLRHQQEKTRGQHQNALSKKKRTFRNRYFRQMQGGPSRGGDFYVNQAGGVPVVRERWRTLGRLLARE